MKRPKRVWRNVLISLWLTKESFLRSSKKDKGCKVMKTKIIWLNDRTNTTMSFTFHPLILCLCVLWPLFSPECRIAPVHIYNGPNKDTLMSRNFFYWPDRCTTYVVVSVNSPSLSMVLRFKRKGNRTYWSLKIVVFFRVYVCFCIISCSILGSSV